MMRVFLLLVCFFCVTELLSQHNSYSVQSFSREYGLPNTTIYSMHEDARGILWFGTENGLYWYNGYSFSRIDNTDSHLSNYITAIIEVDKNNLLIGSREGVFLLNTAILSYTKLAGSFSINSIEKLSSHTFIFASSEHPFLLTYSYGSCVHTHTIDTIALSQETSRVKVDVNGGIWLSHLQNVYYSKNIISGIIETIFSSPYTITGIASLGDMMYVATTQKVYSINIHSKHVSEIDIHSKQNTSYYIKFLDIHSDSTLILTTDNAGILIATIDGEIVEYISKETYPQIASHTIHKAYIDSNNHIWMSVLGKVLQVLIKKTDKNFFHISTEHGLRNPIIKTTLYDSQGTLWIGSDGGGISYITDYKNNKQVTQMPLSPPKIMCFFETEDYIWVGTYINGLHRIHKSSKRIQHIPIIIENKPVENIFAVHILNDSIVLIGSLGYGFVVFNQNKNMVTQITQGELDGQRIDINKFISAIRIDHRENVWVASLGGGVYVFDNQFNLIDRYSITRANNKIESHLIYSLAIDSKNRIWAGSLTGISIIDRDNAEIHFLKATEYPTLSSNHYILCLDSMCYVNSPGYMTEISIQDFSVRPFTMLHGIESIQFRSNHSEILSNGTILVSGDNGISEVNPHRMRKNQQKLRFPEPQIVIQNTLYAFSKNIRLPYYKNTIYIDFPAINYAFTQDIRYAYSISGNNIEFQDLGKKHDMLFMNLAPGTYKITLFAFFEHQQESAKTIDFTIIITPPFWKTMWFIASVFLLLFFIVYFAIKRRFYKMRKQAFILEQKVQERTKFIQAQIEELERLNTALLQKQKKTEKLYSVISQEQIQENISQFQSHEEEFVEKTMAYIYEHIAKESLSVEELSEHANYSKIQFYRKIKKITGLTPNDVIKTTRLKMAEELLSSRNYSIAEVCYKVGFSDPRYFSRCFKDQYSLAPSEYIKSRKV